VDGENRGVAPICACAEGFYDDLDLKTCVPCPHPSDVCITKTEFEHCVDGYYIYGTECIKCNYPCATCKARSSCLSCGFDIERRYPFPTCTCLPKFYSDEPICSPCPYPAIECLTVDHFLSC
jgi:hypothetical protein